MLALCTSIFAECLNGTQWTVKSCGDRLDKSFRMAVCSVYNAKHTNTRYRALTQKCVELQLITTFLFRKKDWVIVSI